MGMMDETDWRRVPKACQDGCQLAAARQMLVQAERLVGRMKEGTIVSQALWCDQGNHAFSVRDSKREHWEREVTNDKGELIKIPWDVCGKHIDAINLQLAAMEAEINGREAPAARQAIPGSVQDS